MIRTKERYAHKDPYGEMARTERQIENTEVQIAFNIVRLGLLMAEMALVWHKARKGK